MTAEELYDTVYDKYSRSKMLPFRRIESFTFLQLLAKSDINSGMLVLDAACGDGFYTRLLLNALKPRCILGVDISKKMIDLALEKSAQLPSETIHFMHQDASQMADQAFQDRLLVLMGKSEMDIVCCTYLFNYAQSIKELETYINSVHSVLKKGGMVVGLNDNPRDDPSWYGTKAVWETGLEKTNDGKMRYEGQPIQYTFLNGDGDECRIVNYWLPPKEIERMFQQAGFERFEWVDIQLPPLDEDMASLLKEQMARFVHLKPITCFRAYKG